MYFLADSLCAPQIRAARAQLLRRRLVRGVRPAACSSGGTGLAEERATPGARAGGARHNQEIPVMIQSLLMMVGMLGIAFGLFGVALARMLRVDGCDQDAAETRHNARLLIVTGTTLLVMSLAQVG
jgi:hypothetical protein